MKAKITIEVHLKIKIAEKNGKFYFRIVNATNPDFPPFTSNAFDTREAALTKANLCLDMAKNFFETVGDLYEVNLPVGTVMSDLDTVH